VQSINFSKVKEELQMSIYLWLLLYRKNYAAEDYLLLPSMIRRMLFQIHFFQFQNTYITLSSVEVLALGDALMPYL
jgi:hypothetical protein